MFLKTFLLFYKIVSLQWIGNSQRLNTQTNTSGLFYTHSLRIAIAGGYSGHRWEERHGYKWANALKNEMIDTEVHWTSRNGEGRGRRKHVSCVSMNVRRCRWCLSGYCRQGAQQELRQGVLLTRSVREGGHQARRGKCPCVSGRVGTEYSEKVAWEGSGSQSWWPWKHGGHLGFSGGHKKPRAYFEQETKWSYRSFKR